MNRHERLVFGLSLICGPLLFSASSFFWVGEGQYGTTGSVLLIFGSIFWSVAFAGIFRVLSQAAPRYSAWALPVAIYGCICGGAGFSFQGFFMELYGVGHQDSLAALGAHPVAANLLFWIGGPAYPLTLLVLGIMLFRTKMLPLWAAALLSLGGVFFPLARIPRIDALAHLVDIMMLAPAWYMAFNMLRANRLSAAGQGES